MDDLIGVGAAWEAVRRRWWWLLVAAALGLVMGSGLVATHPPQAVAGSEVMFQDDPNDPKRADTEVRIATSRAVLDRVAAVLPGQDPASLTHALSATKVTHDVIRLTARGNSAARAGRLADAYTAGYIDYSGGILRQAASDQAAALTRQLDPVNAQLAATNDRLNRLDSDPRLNATGPTGEAARLEQADLQKSQDRMSQDISDLQAKIAAQQVAADRRDWFTPINRSVPVAPGLGARVRRIAAPVLLLPALTAIGIAVARRRDMRLYTADQVARAAGAPVPATLAAPRAPRAGENPPPAHDLTEPQALCYRRAVTRLLETAEGAAVPALTFVHRAEDGTARWAAEHLAGLLPAGAPPVGQLAAREGILPDLDPDTRPVLVVTAGTLTPGALHTLAAACHDAGRAPHAVLLVTPQGPPSSMRPLRPRPRPAGSVGGAPA